MQQREFFSIGELQKFLSQSSHKEFEEALASFSLPQLIDCFILLQDHPILEAGLKRNSLFRSIDSEKGLEELGKKLNPAFFIDYLEFLETHLQFHNRLSFILIGLPQSVFSASLSLLEDRHLAILKLEALIEPLQYHLMQFAHVGEKLLQTIDERAQQFSQSLSSINPQNLTYESLQGLFQKIEDDKNILSNYLEKIQRTLIMVWHTDRIDLIETLSSLHESIQHQISFLIGHQALNGMPATGLYAALEKQFSLVFNGSLQDEDAAIEGMTRLSIWHAKDYFEIGLLPDLSFQESMNLDAEGHNGQKHLESHEKLNRSVQKRLQELGITNVGSLKKLHLFSKSLLKNYIERRRRSSM